MTPLDGYLLEIKTRPEYKELFAVLKKMRPTIPSFRVDDDNTDQWKLVSGRQQGFDLCLSILQIKLGE